MSEQIRVLHVDDEPDFTDLTADALEREDDRLSVETATNAAEGLDRLTESVDCVVSDYDMPGRNGIEFLEAVREQQPALPFVLFTGKGSEEVASEAISAGVTEYLEKGRGLGQYTVLANRITNAVEQYRSKRALESSQRRLSLFFEQSPLGVIEWNEACEVVRLNDAAEEILGYDEADLRGASWERIVPESETTAVGNVVDALLQNRGGYQHVNENVRADGDVIVCEWHNWVVTDDDSVEHSSTGSRPQADDSGGSETPQAAGEAGDGEVAAIFSQFQDVTERAEREQQLERSTARLEALFENSPDMINVHDTEGNIIEPNPQLCERLGYDASELTEMKVWDIDTRIDPAEARALWDEMSVGDRRRLDGVYQCRDGSTFPVEVHIQRLDLVGEERFVVISRDISERKARERELERYETIVETIDDIALVIDDDWIVEYVNETGRRYAGASTNDIVGEPIVRLAREFVAEIDGVARFERALERAFDATPPVDAPERIELRVDASMGEVVLEYQFSPVFGGGEPTAVVITMRDITERTERERTLEATKEQLDTVVSNVPVVLFALDADGVFRLSEGRGLEALGWESSEVVGQSAFDLYADYPDVTAAIERALDGEEVSIVERIEGRVFETAYQPVVEGGRVTGVIGVATDVTERRARERELERQNERLEEFVSVVSHDLQNPLNVAAGRLELAREVFDSEDLDAAARALDRMDELIADLLRLAREGERVNEIESVALADVVEGCWHNVETGAAELVVETERTIRADPGRLQHLLENLLQNSVEHGSTSSRPEADVTITVGDLDDGFYVADDGPGIPESRRTDVFESGYSTAPDGTGFGLAIVAEVVEAHGWSISVGESEAGGARFEITGVTDAAQQGP